MNRPTEPRHLDAVHNVLAGLVDDYYTGAATYHQLPPNDSSLRVFWRIRLGVLAQVGTQLADALNVAGPDWAALNELATPNPGPGPGTVHTGHLEGATP